MEYYNEIFSNDKLLPDLSSMYIGTNQPMLPINNFLHSPNNYPVMAQGTNYENPYKNNKFYSKSNFYNQISYEENSIMSNSNNSNTSEDFSDFESIKNINQALSAIKMQMPAVDQFLTNESMKNERFNYVNESSSKLRTLLTRPELITGSQLIDEQYVNLMQNVNLPEVININNNSFNNIQENFSKYPEMKVTGFEGHEGNELASKKKRTRQTYTRDQTLYLEQEFCRQHFAGKARCKQIAAKVGLTEKRIKIWFQNRRMKATKNKNKIATNCTTVVANNNINLS